jgi:phosphatidylinositol alpha-mannosyltransferase
MKIAITGPHYWPYRRRGSASYIYNLSRHLTEAGHQVEVITGKPGKSRVVTDDNVKIHYLPYLINPLFHGFKLDRVHMFSANCFFHFLSNDYDMIHCMYHPDGFTLSHLRRFKKIRYVQFVATVPFEFHWKHSPIDPYMFDKAVKGADLRIAISHYAQEYMMKNSHIECEHIPCGVDMDRFLPCGDKNTTAPRILCTAALHDERKNIPLLLKAFEMLIDDGVPAVLQLAAETTPAVNKYLTSLVRPDVMKSVQILPTVTHKELPQFYSEASVTVLPSLNETFGMVLIESLACGTPVVGTKSGAIPEIINNPEIGALFEMEDDHNGKKSAVNLCQAIKKTLELSADPQTKERCRQHASPYHWKKITKQLIALYERGLSKTS